MITRQNRHGVAHRVDTARHAPTMADRYRQNHKPERYRINWTEVGWWLSPYLATIICIAALYFGWGAA